MATEKRLIDANALVKQLEKSHEYHARNCREEVLLYRDIRIINEQPTVEAVEVVHGRWIAVPSSDMMTGKAYKCSECGKMRYGSWMPNYCQNCGAKMDGDGNGT